jgi:hypothetical protein
VGVAAAINAVVGEDIIVDVVVGIACATTFVELVAALVDGLGKAPETIMRFGISTVMLTFALAVNPASGQLVSEVMTGPDAILCLSLDNVAAASVSRSQPALRKMGCIRVEAGIRSRLLEADLTPGPIRVRFYPAGISDGLTMWALPSSFLAVAPKTPI